MRHIVCCLVLLFSVADAKVQLGLDRYFSEGISKGFKDQKIALVTNQTGVDSDLRANVDLFKQEGNLIALFAPEHGFKGAEAAGAHIAHGKDHIPIYSLHGQTRRPTGKMLKGIDVIVFDIQDIGSRSYTYISTLFYVMEEAAKHHIKVVVLDRPNPINGVVVDGPGLEEKWRSFIGYIDVPYCHGLTIGELARYFKAEYNIKCELQVVEMRGWNREMSFAQTGLVWIPTSPNVPESTTALYYPMTGILGELGIVNIGIGTTLPFRLVGAPWMDANLFVEKLKKQQIPGVVFHPIHYKPVAGSLKGVECHGALITVTDHKICRPVMTEYIMMGILKSLYPKQFKQALKACSDSQIGLFCKANGTDAILTMLTDERYPAWKMVGYSEQGRSKFLKKRKKYLLYSQ